MRIPLLRLEARRSVGVWLLLAIPFGVWWMIALGALPLAPLWFETSLIIRNAVMIFAPLVAGAAAWMGGREQRRGTADLLATTPYPQTGRLLAIWFGATVWGILGFLVVGGGVFALSLLRATWGGPYYGPILVSLAALPTFGALGFALGYHFPNRLTTPLVAVALFFAQIIGGSVNEWYAYLSPMVSLSRDFRYGIWPNLAPQQLCFLASLGGLALASLALRNAPGRNARIACAALLAVTVGSVAILARTAPQEGRLLTADARYRFPPQIPYEPRCAGTAVPVCVHPAYESYLPELAKTISRLIAPVAGVPGGPVRAEQGYSDGQGRDPRTFWFDIQPLYKDQPFGAYQITPLIQDQALPREQLMANCPGIDRGSCLKAQYTIGRWLLLQAGIPIEDAYFVRAADGSDPTKAIAARFAALDPAQQRAWLEANYADLRAGKVRLEDLP